MGDRAGVARMTLDLGVSADLGGDPDRARAFYERAQQLAREVGDRRYESFAAHNLTNLAFEQADYVLALERGEECLAAARASGDPSNVQWATVLFAYVLAGSGRSLEAQELGFGALRDAIAAGVLWVARDALELLVITNAATGAAERAALLAGLAERLRADTAEPRQRSGERLYRPAVEQTEAALGAERFRGAVARGAGLTLEDAVELASAPLP